MKEHDNDNDELSFITLGAATLNVVRYLVDDSQEHQDEAQRQTERDHTEEEKNNDRREYIDHRLRELAEFERRYNAGIKGRR